MFFFFKYLTESSDTSLPASTITIIGLLLAAVFIGMPLYVCYGRRNRQGGYICSNRPYNQDVEMELIPDMNPPENTI